MRLNGAGNHEAPRTFGARHAQDALHDDRSRYARVAVHAPMADRRDRPCRPSGPRDRRFKSCLPDSEGRDSARETGGWFAAFVVCGWCAAHHRRTKIRDDQYGRCGQCGVRCCAAGPPRARSGEAKPGARGPGAGQKRERRRRGDHDRCRRTRSYGIASCLNVPPPNRREISPNTRFTRLSSGRIALILSADEQRRLWPRSWRPWAVVASWWRRAAA
jgi:hypothetical protein